MRHTEEAFEATVEDALLAEGYVRVAKGGYDRARGLFPETLLAFLRDPAAPLPSAAPPIPDGRRGVGAVGPAG